MFHRIAATPFSWVRFPALRTAIVGAIMLMPLIAIAQVAEGPGGAPAAPDTAAAKTTAADTAAADTAADNTATRAVLINLGVAIALFVGSIALGSWIARWARLPDHATKFAVIVFATATSIVVTALGWPPRLGIDLRGGVILIYDIDRSQFEAGQTTLDTMTIDKLVGAVAERVNPGGVREVTVRPYGVGQIEIIIPEPRDAAREGGGQSSEELERIERIISQTGALEFRIVADRRNPADAGIMARATSSTANPTAKDVVETDADGSTRVVARWIALDKTEDASSYVNSPNFATRTGPNGQVQVLLMVDPYNVTGEYLRSASAGFDQAGKPSIHFGFDSRGANLFGQLTSSNLPQGDFYRLLAIVLDGRVKSAPRINSAIYDRGEITGNFTRQETEDYAKILTAGQLPAALRHEPTSSMVIGPTLGADTIRKGVNAMLIATGVVIVFMLVYYRFAGIVANFAVILNVLLTVAFMVLVKAAFTLSGLAGLALTVGMAVDANVLIYERIREELARGATLRMAIRNGFERATTTIIDSNVTTLIAAVVLYVIGTDQVKGFAVTLFLGIMMNLFTAITVSRALFDIAEKKRWVSNLKFMQMMTGANYDFIGKRRAAIALSLVVIGIGMAGVVARGKGLLDIDFTGGVSVETLFDPKHPQEVAVVRSKLEALGDALPDLTVQDVKIGGEQPGLRFLVITSEPDEAKVEREIQELFRGQLAYNHAKLAGSDPIVAATETPSKTSDGKATVPSDDPAANEGDDADADTDTPPADKKKGAAAKDDDASGADDEATKAEKPKDEKPKDEKPKDEKPKDEKPKDEKAKDDKPSTDKPADDNPANDKTVDDKPRDPFDGGVTVHLQFDQPITHDTLDAMLHSALDENSATKGAAVLLTSADYETGSERAQAKWDAKLAIPPARVDDLVKRVEDKMSDKPFFPSSNKIGAAVATNTQQQAIVALVASTFLITLYVWFRFSQVMFGLSVIVALMHDVLVTLGALALSYWLAPYLGFAGVEPFKINLPIIAAFLTIIGYSLNDTIVIFDRIREIRGKSPDLSVDLVNTSINQTLSRTLLTSLTVFLVVLILYAVGGQGIHGFAFALVIGTISGTYSTIYIATPVLIWLNDLNRRSQARAQPPRRTAQPAGR